MKLGFTTTSFRQIRNKERIVSIAKTCGADILEWGGDIHVKNVADAEYAKRLCDAAGIGISSYGSYYRIGTCDAAARRRVCEIAAAMGCGSVRVWLGTADSEKTDGKTYLTLVSDAAALCGDAAGCGLKVCCECHDNTYNNNTDAFLRIREEVGQENFCTYFQSRYRKKAYDLDRIERTLPYTESVHVSFSEQRREQFPRYDGAYLDALLEKLLACGFDGNLLLEYTYLCGYWGIPAAMRRDMEKIRKRVGLQ
jgi:hypothetical protein